MGDDRISLKKLKQALFSTDYFITEKPSNNTMSYLVYHRHYNGVSFILKRTNIKTLIKDVKKITGITDKDIEKQNISIKEKKLISKRSSPPDVGTYWWNKDD